MKKSFYFLNTLRLVFILLAMSFLVGCSGAGGGGNDPAPDGRSNWKIVGNTVVSEDSAAPSKYSVYLTLQDPDEKISKVLVEGPGVLSTHELLKEMVKVPSYTADPKAFWAKSILFDSIPTETLLYNISVTSTDGEDTTSYTVANNFIDAVKNMSPADKVTISNQPVFAWDPPTAQGVEYSLILKKMTNLFGTQTPVIQDVRNVTTATAQFDTALEDGEYFWTVNAFVKNDAGELIAMAMSEELSFIMTATPETTPPTVTSTSPALGATDVRVASAVSLSFDEAMVSSAFTTSTFSVNNGVTDIDGTMTYTGTTATFTPAASLADNTTYTVTVAATVTDLAGNALGAPYSFSFTTGSSDQTAPTVTSTSPSDNVTGVPANSAITITFSEAMTSADLTTTTLTVNDGTSNITGAVTYGGSIATFTPSSALAYSTAYTVTLAETVTDLAGNALGTSHSFSFTTGAEGSTGGGAILSKIPDTGQTTSYTDTFGEDSDYSINPPSYTDNGDGTVTDNVTGLMWQQQGDGNTYNWYQASGTADSTSNPGGGHKCL